MKVTAVIPIRKGSQRVENKNIRPFAGSDLLTIKINNLKQISRISEIIVNTDCEDAIQIAKQLNVSFHKREPYYASSECTGSEFFEHLGKVTDTDMFAYCPVTSPFIKKETIEDAIKSFNNNFSYDCLSTVNQIKEFLWLDDRALNYDPQNAPNSQNLPNILALNFGFTLIRREDLILNKNIIGKKPMFIQTSDIESIDIDTPLDFFIAEQIYIRTILETKGLLD